MESILDMSNSYLRIFTQKVEIDNNLPKWKVINEEKNKVVNKDKSLSNYNKKLILNGETDIDEDYEDDSLTLSNFLGLNSSEFNIYIGKKVANNIISNYKSNSFWSENETTEVNGNSKDSKTIIQKVTKFFRKVLNSNGVETEEVYQLNIFEFFDNVKGLLKESVKTYISRIEPYMIALKQAQEMGQTALVDKLTTDIFLHKYESILYAAGFYKKITEEQLVDFVKKSEKGVQLCYVKNFIRPIPEGVIKIKQEADKLLVFDNYCILYYDKDTKSFSKTEAEKEVERKKKADPILFGMIHGSRNLYYIADWIDKYCDLTID